MKHALLIDAERATLVRDWNDGIIVDNFAGGGGASTGIEQSCGRHGQ
jgi:DNA (cytosine-5)-methyltransferase 1